MRSGHADYSLLNVVLATTRHRVMPTTLVRAREALDRLYQEYDDQHTVADPVHIVRRYADPADREIVGFCAAGLAFGRVASVIDSVESLLAVMGTSPAAFVRGFDPDRDGRSVRALGHRWISGHDLTALLWILRRMVETSGSIGAFFQLGYAPAAEDIGSALDSFCTRARAFGLDHVYGTEPARRGVGYFFPRPGDGSACKRLNLYLRWMVRHDRIDFGLWPDVDRAKLVVPLDTHVIRVGTCLGLTRRRSPGWAMAHEITAGLRRLDPTDPVKYDFALCHLGMQNACGFNQPQRDDRCPLQGVCRPGQRRRRPSRPPSERP